MSSNMNNYENVSSISDLYYYCQENLTERLALLAAAISILLWGVIGNISLGIRLHKKFRDSDTFQSILKCLTIVDGCVVLTHAGIVILHQGFDIDPKDTSDLMCKIGNGILIFFRSLSGKIVSILAVERIVATVSPYHHRIIFSKRCIIVFAYIFLIPLIPSSLLMLNSSLEELKGKTICTVSSVGMNFFNFVQLLFNAVIPVIGYASLCFLLFRFQKISHLLKKVTIATSVLHESYTVAFLFFTFTYFLITWPYLVFQLLLSYRFIDYEEKVDKMTGFMDIVNLITIIPSSLLGIFFLTFGFIGCRYLSVAAENSAKHSMTTSRRNKSKCQRNRSSKRSCEQNKDIESKERSIENKPREKGDKAEEVKNEKSEENSSLDMYHSNNNDII